MRIGLCTTDIPHALPAEQLFEKIAALGYDTVQLAFASVAECGFTPSAHIEIPESVSDAAIEAIKSASRSTGVSIGAINGTWNMAHPDKSIRDEAIRRMDGFLKAVSALGCPIVSLCSGTRSPVHLWHDDPANKTEAAWADMLDSMKRACALAETYGVLLAIETEAGNIIDTPEKARRVMDETGSPALKMVLDAANLFHAGEASRANMRPRLDKAMAYFGKDVILAHGKDIREGDGIEFCGAGFGIVDFPHMIRSLRLAGFAGDMMLHGIEEERNLASCRAYMMDCMRQAEE